MIIDATFKATWIFPKNKDDFMDLYFDKFVWKIRKTRPVDPFKIMNMINQEPIALVSSELPSLIKIKVFDLKNLVLKAKIVVETRRIVH